MKSKPDVSGFSPPKDPTAFLEGGRGDRPARPGAPERDAESPEPEQPSTSFKPEPTVQKLFRLRWDVANALKAGAAQASATTGRRVTETEIIEDLIRKHFKLAR